MTVDLAIIARFWAGAAGRGGRLITSSRWRWSTAWCASPAAITRPRIRTALLLPQGGEFGFVLFSTAVAAGVMQQEQATLLVALVTMTMALTPLLAALAPLAARAKP